MVANDEKPEGLEYLALRTRGFLELVTGRSHGEREPTGAEEKRAIKSSPVDPTASWTVILLVVQGRLCNAFARSICGADSQQIAEDVDVYQLLLQSPPSSCGLGRGWRIRCSSTLRQAP